MVDAVEALAEEKSGDLVEAILGFGYIRVHRREPWLFRDNNSALKFAAMQFPPIVEDTIQDCRDDLEAAIRSTSTLVGGLWSENQCLSKRETINSLLVLVQ